ncbi:MAG: NAD(P)H-dependent glycerol-3-phosphate dehydrogenase [Actinomycetota bacterium]
MARVTVFGAGAMGTALAIHLARKGEEVALWGSEFDARVLPDLLEKRSHPALPHELPPSVRVLGPEDVAEAGKGADLAVMAASSNGARSLARLVKEAVEESTVVVSIAKGLEPETRKRMSWVYQDELGGRSLVAVGGPSLAAEVSEGLPGRAVFAAASSKALDLAASTFRSPTYGVDTTDDVLGVELCGTTKNVGAIGAGILEGMGAQREQAFKNARAALFSRAIFEMANLVEGAGGDRETALGLAGVGDLLVTSIGGRNRTYGEAIGEGADPLRRLEDMQEQGMTVEGVDSARDVHELAATYQLDLPVHDAVYRIVHGGAKPESILEALV